MLHRGVRAGVFRLELRPYRYSCYRVGTAKSMSSFGGQLSVDAFDAWFEVLAKWSNAAKVYTDEVGSAGAKVFPLEWPVVIQTIALTENATSPWRGSAGGGYLQVFTEIAAAGDFADALSHKVADVMRLLVSEQIKESLTRGMSRTYSESFGSFLKNVLICDTAVRNAKRSAYHRAAAEGDSLGESLGVGDFAKLAEIHAATARGGFATELYVTALVHSGSSELISAAKDIALGAPADTAQLAAADSAMLAEYHPSQTMCHAAFPAAPSPLLDAGPLASFPQRATRQPKFASDTLDVPQRPEPTPVYVPVDLAFPQAQLGVRYRLELPPNVDRRYFTGR